MKINIRIGDQLSSSLQNVEYINSQTVSFVYVLDSSAENLGTDVPEKKNYETLSSSYEEHIVAAMNYTDYDDIIPSSLIKYRQYGYANTPESRYTSTISVYKKEIWYDFNRRGVPEAREENNYHLLTELSNHNIIYDFNIGNNRYYKYAFRFVYPITFNKELTYSLIEKLYETILPLRSAWLGWTLTELHKVSDTDDNVYSASLTDVWKFKYNISPGDYSQGLSKTQQETLSAYPKFISGPKNTISGQVSCLLGRDVELFNWQTNKYSYGKGDNGWGWYQVGIGRSLNGDRFLYDPSATTGDTDPVSLNSTFGDPFYTSNYNSGGYQEKPWDVVVNRQSLYVDRTSNEQLDLLKYWQKFCYSAEPKLLRDATGNAYIVQISDPSWKIEELQEKRPITINFSWTQIKDAKDCQILWGGTNGDSD